MSGSQAELFVPPIERLRERQSEKWRAHPPDVLPLTVAEMDFELAEPVRNALHAAVDRSDAGYAMPAGSLGAAFAGFAERRWRWTVDPARVSAVADVGVGVVEVLRLLARPGQAVVISPPVYPPFFDWVPEAGCRIHEVPLVRREGAWRLDLAGLEAAFARRPAAYVLCHPHNPVGRVHDVDELTALVRLAQRHDVRIVSDEIHAPLVLHGATFTPFLTVPGAADVGVAVVSASKAWNLAGLKCAAVVTASSVAQAVVDGLPPEARWRVGHFGVIASVAAWNHGEDYLDRLLSTLDRRRATLADLLRERLPDIAWQPPEATYLAWLDCRTIRPDDDARELFLDRGKVALEPGRRFGAAGLGYCRLNFATSTAILDRATAAMAAALRAGPT
jgi:cysteine-S-conjugate beta-lyase